ncbi:MAG: LysM peptidoglycan-binding domain-containing protein [Robiginitomaculum sp.]|nr:LysM peptidoglycan-binding domain-containing protein [Robiginitomaculum sp.]
MRILSGALMATTMLVIGGCSTTAVNPNYQQTTKYKGSSPHTNEAVVEQARYQTGQDQIQAPAPVTYAATYENQATPTSAIQETTQSLGDAGTPGYYAVNGGTPAPQTTEPQYAQIQPTRPQAPHPAPVSTQTAYTAPAQIPPSGTIRHRVIPGDTLYSLARSTCSSVAEIQNLNSINQDFYIRADDDILVPSGRCAE